ncbi:MAG: AAA family ATPase [Bacilli bacterium]|nr:AAA family ATPase [Bacilli bacterium]
MEKTWVDFYTSFANKLLEYSDDRKTLISKIKKVYSRIGINVPTIEQDNNNIIDIDPFTIFALFNRQISEYRRLEIIKGLIEEFEVKANVPSDFYGIPVVNNMSTAFFAFLSWRNTDNIDNLWHFFKIAIKYQNDESLKEDFIRWFDICREQKQVKWNLTMGLFWVAPKFYVALDSRNRWFLNLKDHFDNDFVSFMRSHHAYEKSTIIPTGKEYLEIRSKCIELVKESNQFDSLIDLSFRAWELSEKVNQQNRIKEDDEVLEERGIHTWIYSPGDNANRFEEFYKEGIFAIDWSDIDNPLQYATKEELRLALQKSSGDEASHKNDVNCIWEFINDIEIGDIIFAKKGRSIIVGRGQVESDYIYDSTRKDYKNIRKIKWTHKGNWEYPRQVAMKTLTDITNYIEDIEKLNSLVSNDEDIEIVNDKVKFTEYSKTSFLKDVYLSESSYDKLVTLLLKKKNIIIQGAPGVGKTFAAKRLAYSIMGEKASDRVEMIQFHQSYSYEDFIMGYRPNEKGFILEKGSFYNFCKKAENDKENKYFYIIDEINRGNLNKIFGELFLLIEEDKRDETKVRLLYSNEMFSIPSNVYIIGLMNTADRSLAMMDYALRRRFAFFTMVPAFDNKEFQDYLDLFTNEKLNKLIKVVKKLNEDIIGDVSLGKGFVIGHSYFCNLDKEANLDVALSNIVEYELIPLIEEYWFDEPQKVEEWSNDLRDIVR